MLRLTTTLNCYFSYFFITGTKILKRGHIHFRYGVRAHVLRQNIMSWGTEAHLPRDRHVKKGKCEQGQSRYGYIPSNLFIL